MDIRNTILQFVSEELLRDGEPLDGDENLLADGMVDSLGMLRLVGFIEETFDLKVQPEDFVIENFRTVNVLSDFLGRAGSSGDND